MHTISCKLVSNVPNRKKPPLFHRPRNILPKICIGTIGLCSGIVGPSLAADPRQIAEFNASGFVFKDSVEMVAVDDPGVTGVTLYLSDFKRSFADKLKSLDFANEPSQASITCAANGPVTVPSFQSIEGAQGKEVFSATRSRSLLFFGNKTLRIRRILDEKNKSLVYVSYSTRINSAGEDGTVTTGRYRTSLCVISHVEEAPKLKE